jgi:hypothetical protein
MIAITGFPQQRLPANRCLPAMNSIGILPGKLAHGYCAEGAGGALTPAAIAVPCEELMNMPKREV